MSLWRVKPKGCKACGSTAHTAFTCPWKRRKPLSKRGKVTKKWLATRDLWLEHNKAPYYFCHYCDKMMTRTQLTLDHYESRSRHPELRFALNNLVPCCAVCNEDKGSRSGDEYMEIMKTRRG